MPRSKQPEDLNSSILSGSEEVYDFFCQPCSPEQHLEAVGYCQDCRQYMCITCIKCHGKLAVSAHHKVLDKSAMPKTKIPRKIVNTDVLTEICRKHPDKVMEYFCKTHNQICCSVCVTLDHGSCPDKNYIPDISDKIANNHEYRKLLAEIDRLIGEITKRQEIIGKCSKNTEKCHAKALEDIKEVRKQINELLDKFEDDTKQKAAQFHQENVGIIESVSEKYQSLLSEVSSMAADIDVLAKTGKSNQLFVQVKMYSKRRAEIERQLEESGNFRLTPYTFNQDDKIPNMTSTLSVLWSLTVRDNYTPTKARYVCEVNTKATDDTGKCRINGIALLDKDRMAVTDYDNKAVKLIDTKVNKVISYLSLSSIPYDITVIKSDRVAVVLENGRDERIGIITVSNSLAMNQTIKLPGVGSVGLCSDGSNFMVAYQNPARIKIINMLGKTLNTISTGGHDKQLFTSPRSVALTNEKDIAYITDLDANNVTSVCLSGPVNWVYTHKKLQYPSGVAVGKDGSVYVCSKLSHTVYQLSPTGGLQQIILALDQGLPYFPFAIAYDGKFDLLYISSDDKVPVNSDCIKIYQLK